MWGYDFNAETQRTQRQAQRRDGNNVAREHRRRSPGRARMDKPEAYPTGRVFSALSSALSAPLR